MNLKRIIIILILGLFSLFSFLSPKVLAQTDFASESTPSSSFQSQEEILFSGFLRFF